MLNYRIARHALVILAMWFVVAATATQGLAQPKIVSQGDETRHAGEFVVPINKSQVLQLDVPFKDLLVGNSEIADVLALTDRTVYVLGKSLGSTSLTIYGREKQLIAVVDLVVAPDIEGLKAKLFELMPDEEIEIRPGNGAILVSGSVSNARRLSDALTVAERFAPGLVTNLMSVRGSQQVMLKVRFVEVNRDVSKELGFKTNLFDSDVPFAIATGGNALSIGPTPEVLGGAGGLVPTFSNTFPVTSVLQGAALANVGSLGLAVFFDALEQKGLSKTLAEPNLIAMSGDTASFLAGGEFPIEVAQSGAGATGDAAITVEFKEFGVSLAFTPTVLDDGLINLVVNPEVSTLDFGRVARNGVPGLQVRRASTTVELRDGQSFAIAGLLQDDFDDNISQVPLLGDIPVLGALFRSSDFLHQETELVIIVEPRLVQPVPAGSLATPADNFIPPSEADIWLFGRLEAPNSGIPQAGALSAAGAGGISGHYGHIIK
jgi:pilus assembly protein CpaC